MARHYLSDAMRDLLVWKGESDSVSFALGLPEFVTFRNGVRLMAGELAELTASVIWVHTDGKVEVSPNSL